eukprot:TRINITY_DN60_c0_g3_i2.p1 TRINITY_DN60_c0_g3~~TRINITY_DN60_c0_g3_i2.p1  ORF type:complete len:238 (+),score=35.98 TRINITY_DN60_c0_g3_i2:307-1020(+)
MDKNKKVSWYFFRKRIKNLKSNHNNLKSLHTKLLSDYHDNLRTLFSVSMLNSNLLDENIQLKSKISNLQIERERLSTQLFEKLHQLDQFKSCNQNLQGELNLAKSQVSCISKLVLSWKSQVESSQRQHEMDFTQLLGIINTGFVQQINPLEVESKGVYEKSDLFEKDLADESTDDEAYLPPDADMEFNIYQVESMKNSICAVKRIKCFPYSIIPKEISKVKKWCNQAQSISIPIKPN